MKKFIYIALCVMTVIMLLVSFVIAMCFVSTLYDYEMESVNNMFELILSLCAIATIFFGKLSGKFYC